MNYSNFFSETLEVFICILFELLEIPIKLVRYFSSIVSKSKEKTDFNFKTNAEEELTIQWQINHLNRSTLKSGEYFESPTFSTGFYGEVTWCLRIYPRGRKSNMFGNVNVGLFLYKITEKPLESNVSYQFYSKVFKGYEREIWYPKNNYSWNSKSEFAKIPKGIATKSSEYGTDEFSEFAVLISQETLHIICTIRANDVYTTEQGPENSVARKYKIICQ